MENLSKNIFLENVPEMFSGCPEHATLREHSANIPGILRSEWVALEQLKVKLKTQ